MSFFFSLKATGDYTFDPGSYNVYEDTAAIIISASLSDSEQRAVMSGEMSGDRVIEQKSSGFMCVFDKETKHITLWNDPFGSQEIVYRATKEGWMVAQDVRSFDSEELRLDKNALYEFFLFNHLSPPLTMYEGVLALPLASKLVISKNNDGLFCPEVSEYLDFQTFFSSKFESYEKAVEAVRASLERVISDVISQRCRSSNPFALAFSKAMGEISTPIRRFGACPCFSSSKSKPSPHPRSNTLLSWGIRCNAALCRY
jgi:hypothetical protein